MATVNHPEQPSHDVEKSVVGTLRWFFFGLLIMAICVISLQVAVDPYRLWGTADVIGFNAAKPLAKKQMRMAKRYQVARRRPKAVVMGTSRSLVALALDHPSLIQRRPFALALEAATPHETAAMFALAAREGQVQVAVLGIEYSRWISTRRDRPGFDDARLQPRPSLAGWLVPTAADALAAGFSWQALAASFETLQRNSDSPPPLETLGSPARWRRDDPKRPQRRQRTLAMFDYKQRETARHALKNHPHAQAAWQKNRKILTAILDVAAAANIRLEIVISPCHARHFETLAQTGHSALYDAWLTDVATLISTHKAHARLWDFGGYTPFTTEKGPTQQNPRVTMRWHWESSHYTPELGDLVLNAVLSDDPQSPERVLQSGLGQIVTADNVAKRIADFAVQRQKWREAAPQEVREVARIVAAIRASP